MACDQGSCWGHHCSETALTGNPSSKVYVAPPVREPLPPCGMKQSVSHWTVRHGESERNAGAPHCLRLCPTCLESYVPVYPDIVVSCLCTSCLPGVLPPFTSSVPGVLSPSMSLTPGVLPPSVSDLLGVLPTFVSYLSGVRPPCMSCLLGALYVLRTMTPVCHESCHESCLPGCPACWSLVSLLVLPA
jgi:hypothetical protein